MRKDQAIKIFAGLRDLEILDSDGELCGIADEIELDGEPLSVSAILVGPGAWGQRLPRPLAYAVRRLVGEGLVRIPWDAVGFLVSKALKEDYRVHDFVGSTPATGFRQCCS